MYAYIKGVLADVEEESVVVEAGGIGYRIYTTGQTFDYLPAVGEEVKLYTYLNVREDAMILYGCLQAVNRRQRYRPEGGAGGAVCDDNR